MFLNHINHKSLLAVFVTLFVGAIFSLTNSCSNNRNASLKCVSDHILANIEKEKIADFIKLEGVYIDRGWGDLTYTIAEDFHVIDECGVRQYLAQFNLSLDDLKGRAFFVYSIHSYLKHGKVDPEAIIQEVDALFFKE